MWKTVSFNDKYEINEKGQVRRKDNQNLLKGQVTKNGYHTVKLTFENSKQQRFYVHRLVALHFIPNLDKKKTIVNHKDGNKLNNNVENLEWVTPRENNLHYYREIQKEKKERKNGGKAIPVIQYDLNGKEIAKFPSMSAARKATGISIVQIARCVHNEVKSVNGYIFKSQ